MGFTEEREGFYRFSDEKVARDFTDPGTEAVSGDFIRSYADFFYWQIKQNLAEVLESESSEKIIILIDDSGINDVFAKFKKNKLNDLGEFPLEEAEVVFDEIRKKILFHLEGLLYQENRPIQVYFCDPPFVVECADLQDANQDVKSEKDTQGGFIETAAAELNFFTLLPNGKFLRIDDVELKKSFLDEEIRQELEERRAKADGETMVGAISSRGRLIFRSCFPFTNYLGEGLIRRSDGSKIILCDNTDAWNKLFSLPPHPNIVETEKDNSGFFETYKPDSSFKNKEGKRIDIVQKYERMTSAWDWVACRVIRGEEGERLKFNFSDLVELVNSILDCMKGALFLYKHDLVLMDISLDNIGIVRDGGNTKGKLFDLEGVWWVYQSILHRTLKLSYALKDFTDSRYRFRIHGKEMVGQFGIIFNKLFQLEIVSYKYHHELVFLKNLCEICNKMCTKDQQERTDLPAAIEQTENALSDLAEFYEALNYYLEVEETECDKDDQRLIPDSDLEDVTDDMLPEFYHFFEMQEFDKDSSLLFKTGELDKIDDNI